MRVKSSYLFAAGIGLVVALYFIVGSIFGGGDKKKGAEAKPVPAAALPSVQVVLTNESQHGYDVVIRGRTESARTVVVKSESAGTVASTPATEGSFVAKGAVLCRLNIDATRPASTRPAPTCARAS